jgi:hypothetical protein
VVKFFDKKNIFMAFVLASIYIYHFIVVNYFMLRDGYYLAFQVPSCAIISCYEIAITSHYTGIWLFYARDSYY